MGSNDITPTETPNSLRIKRLEGELQRIKNPSGVCSEHSGLAIELVNLKEQIKATTTNVKETNNEVTKLRITMQKVMTGSVVILAGINIALRFLPFWGH